MHSIPQRAQVEAKWEALTARAKQMDPNFTPPVVPYLDSHVVGLHNMNGLELTSQHLIPPA